MYIKSVHIENYKSYKGCFDISLNDGINILVGNNEAGKSTLIEAIHLALTGILNGRYLKNELSQYLFNNDIVNEYLDNLKNGRPASLPHILIELYIGGDDCPLFCGNANSHREDDCGLSYKITFDERYRDVYEELIKQDVKTLPIEYYDVVWTSFAREVGSDRLVQYSLSEWVGCLYIPYRQRVSGTERDRGYYSGVQKNAGGVHGGRIYRKYQHSIKRGQQNLE